MAKAQTMKPKSSFGDWLKGLTGSKPAKAPARKTTAKRSTAKKATAARKGTKKAGGARKATKRR